MWSRIKTARRSRRFSTIGYRCSSRVSPRPEMRLRRAYIRTSLFSKVLPTDVRVVLNADPSITSSASTVAAVMTRCRRGSVAGAVARQSTAKMAMAHQSGSVSVV